jgi:hypothetical protein
MPQLVGSTCALCQEGVTNELDAGFCATCGQGSHFSCRGPQPGVEGRCATCGGAFDAAEVARRTAEHQEAARRRQEPVSIPPATHGREPGSRPVSPPAPPVSSAAVFREVRLLYQFAGFLIPAGLLVALGVVFIVSPEMRDNPKTISVGDVGRGLAISMAGIAVVLLGWWWYRNARRRAARSSVKAGLVSEAINAAVRGGE